mgnify:CR=1 FL=1
MSYEKVKQAKKIKVGTKQTTKALQSGACKEIIIAQDADEKIVTDLKKLAEEQNVPVYYVDSMKKLGQAARIQVGAAVVAIIE